MIIKRNGLSAEMQKPEYSLIYKQSNCFRNNEEYKIKDEVLNDYFRNHTENNDVNTVLKKVTLINSFYNTFIQNDELVLVAQHIVELNKMLKSKGESLDKRIDDGDIDIVNIIAYYADSKKITHNIYSFASKYCSFHKSDKFPLVDSYTKGMIYFTNKSDHYCEELINTSMKSLNDYRVFCEMYKAFQDKYATDKKDSKLPFKTIDEYIWLYAKDKADNDETFKKIIRIENSEKPDSVDLKI
jgi:hypothetical protein